MSTTKVYTPLIVTVRIFDVQTNECEKEVTRTIDSHERRQWIADTVVWGTLNGKWIEIVNQKDDKEPSGKE